MIHNLFQGILHDLNKNFDIIKLVTQSLVKCHKQAVVSVGDGQLDQNTLVDGRYPHSEVSLSALGIVKSTNIQFSTGKIGIE